MKLVIANEVLTETDAQIGFRSLQYFLPLVQKEWGTLFNDMELVSCLDKTKPYLPSGQDGVIYLTERNRKASAKGYHTVEGIVPVGYCSLKASGSIFGRVHRPLVVRGKTYGKFSFLGMGLVGVVAHELAEIIADPKIQTVAKNLDSQMRRWLVEIADPVAKNYLLFTDPATKTDVVLPDVVTRSFYDLQGKAPYSLAHAVSAPFTLGIGGYAFEVLPDGTYKKIT